MDEPRVYSNSDDINRLVKAAEHNYDIFPPAHDLKQGLYQCHFPSPERIHFTQGDRAEPDDITKAGIICLGGIVQVDDQIGALPKKAQEFFSEKGMWPESAGVLTYESVVPRQRRFHEEYEWVKNKAYVSEEMAALADQIFQAKFVRKDDEGKETLVPPEEFKGFCFLTYSFGHRMASMVENALRNRLKSHAESDATIQNYFDRIRMVSIASAVDIEGLAANNPSIKSIQLISRNDRAVMYWGPFADKFITRIDLKKPYAKANLQKTFGKAFSEDGKGHTAIVFASDPQVSGRHPDDAGHGLSRYMELMAKLSPQDLRLIADALNVGEVTRGAGAGWHTGRASSQEGGIRR